MWRRFLHRWAARLKTKIVIAETAAGSLAPLFERSLLVSFKRGAGAFLHHYLRTDPDRGLHNHPWEWAIAIPLAGGCIEERATGCWGLEGLQAELIARKPFRPFILRARDLHRLILPEGKTSWSIFIHGPYCRGWGFVRPAHTRPDRLAAPGTHSLAYRYQEFAPAHFGRKAADWEKAKRGRALERAAP